MYAILCGGRYYEFEPQDYVWLERQHALNQFRLMLVGSDGSWDAERRMRVGADHYGKLWATKQGINTITVWPNWTAHGKSAGPRRNGLMLRIGILLAQADGEELCVLAFPGNRGAADMCRQANAAGVRVYRSLDRTGDE